ncbi:hypothetical protein D3C76_598450 [compost metagenome]
MTAKAGCVSGGCLKRQRSAKARDFIRVAVQRPSSGRRAGVESVKKVMGGGGLLGFFGEVGELRREADGLKVVSPMRSSAAIGARPFGATINIASYKQGGRAQMVQASLARNKCGSELARDAPRGRRSMSAPPPDSRQTPKKTILSLSATGCRAKRCIRYRQDDHAKGPARRSICHSTAVTVCTLTARFT